MKYFYCNGTSYHLALKLMKRETTMNPFKIVHSMLHNEFYVRQFKTKSTLKTTSTVGVIKNNNKAKDNFDYKQGKKKSTAQPVCNQANQSLTR